MPRSGIWAPLAAGLVLGLLRAGPVAALPLSTCSLTLTSTDASGATVDTAVSGAPDATHADPFQVEWDGQVTYDGTTNTLIRNYTYSVEVFGVPAVRGGDANEEGDTVGDGTVDVGGNSPFRAAGLYHVSGVLTGEGGTCQGSAWFLLRGNPVGTVPWILGVVLLVLGSLGYVAGSRGHVATSVAGGILFGLGADLLLISHAALPLAENTPLAVLVVALVLGAVIGGLGLRARRDRQARAAAGADAEPVAPSPPPA